jgi:hypothetical protein
MSGRSSRPNMVPRHLPSPGPLQQHRCRPCQNLGPSCRAVSKLPLMLRGWEPHPDSVQPRVEKCQDRPRPDGEKCLCGPCSDEPQAGLKLSLRATWIPREIGAATKDDGSFFQPADGFGSTGAMTN